MSEEQFPTYESSGFSVDTSPRPFGEMPSLWLKVTQMTEEFFAQEAPRASGSNVLISLVILAVVSAILSAISSAISSLLGSSFQAEFLPPEYRNLATGGMGGGVMAALCSGLIGTIVGFYVGNGLSYLGARIFGGNGDFGTQTYLQSLIAVPVGIVSGLVGLVPCVGPLVAIVAAIYGFVLSVRAIKVAHNLTTGKAVAAILVPGLVLGVIVVCLVMVPLILLGPQIGEVFEDIVNNLQ